MSAQLESLSRVIEPVKEELHEIEQQIDDLEAEIERYVAERRGKMDALKEKRTAAIRIIRFVDADDPAIAKYQKAKPGPKKSSSNGRTRLGPDGIVRLREWLSANAPDEFTVRDLLDRGVGMSKESVSTGLEALRDDGFIRLDRVAYPEGSPGRGHRPKIYKLAV